MAEVWEYRVVSLGVIKPVVVLNQFGKDGWQLVSVTQWDRNTVAYMKRRRDEHRGENADG